MKRGGVTDGCSGTAGAIGIGGSGITSDGDDGGSGVKESCSGIMFIN